MSDYEYEIELKRENAKLRAELAAERETVAAYITSSAKCEAELIAEREAHANTRALIPNSIRDPFVTPRAPGEADWWSVAATHRRQRRKVEKDNTALRDALKDVREVLAGYTCEWAVERIDAALGGGDE